MKTTRCRGIRLALTAWLVLPLVAGAQRDTARKSAGDSTVHITIGGFVDAYYAFDFNRPPSFDRPYTTQAARHNEFNVNLAFVDATLDAARIRGRLALQVGTSVQSNYAGEPRIGAVSGPDLTRHVQEAVVGVRLSDDLWVDGGIFYSHIGSESWVSRDNLTYTRSLIAEYSPYYESGVRMTWQPTPSVALQLDVINGWQNVSETNSDKAVGARVDWTASPKATLSFYNFVGNEAPDSVERHLRIFQGASVKLRPSSRVSVVGTFDFGAQRAGSRSDTWYGGSFIARVQANSGIAIVGRVERYDDGHQVIIATGTAHGLQATGASLGLDVSPQPRLLWRSELRMFSGPDAVFPDRSTSGFSKRDAAMVTSLALTF